MAHFEKRLSQRQVYKGRIFTITVDTVQLENGARAEREIVHHNGGACVAALNREGEIYLVRQFRYAFGQELLELPAGKLEFGENPLEAAKRELSEECGLTARHWRDLGPVYPTVGFCTEIIYTYLATGLEQGALHLDEDEFVTPETLPLEQAVQLVLNGTIKDGKTVAAILKLAAKKAAGEL